MHIKANILLVEDDLNLGILLQDHLSSEKYEVILARDGQEALEQFNEKKGMLDLCILDVMLPKMDGFTLAKKIREEHPIIPIVFLTAKGLKQDKLEGFAIGGDDYITKPFDEDELTCRIEAILRRKDNQTSQQQKPISTITSIGKFVFDYHNQILAYDGVQRKITAKENDILKLLCEHKNQLLKRETALEIIYGKNDYFFGRSFDVFITKLRKYLKDDPELKIENIHGVGFRFIVP